MSAAIMRLTWVPLQGPVLLTDIKEPLKPHAKQMELDIDAYLTGSNKDMQSKCLIAQEILRQVRDKHRDTETASQKHLIGVSQESA